MSWRSRSDSHFADLQAEEFWAAREPEPDRPAPAPLRRDLTPACVVGDELRMLEDEALAFTLTRAAERYAE
jgi:hypothetical protein